MYTKHDNENVLAYQENILNIFFSFLGKGQKSKDCTIHQTYLIQKVQGQDDKKNGTECQKRNLLMIVPVAKCFRVQEYFVLYHCNLLINYAQVIHF